jgi:hypothetical protein
MPIGLSLSRLLGSLWTATKWEDARMGRISFGMLDFVWDVVVENTAWDSFESGEVGLVAWGVAGGVQGIALE